MLMRCSGMLELQNRPGRSDVISANFCGLSTDVCHVLPTCVGIRVGVLVDDLKASMNTTWVNQEETLGSPDDGSRSAVLPYVEIVPRMRATTAVCLD